MSQSLYDAIGVLPSATQEEIEAACIRLGEECNPANNPGNLQAAVRFKEIEHAYEILSNSGKRQQYDLEKPSTHIAYRGREGINAKQLFGIIGSVVLFVGVFAPIVSIPVMGNMNYFQNGKGDGIVILILAVASFILTLRRNYKKLWITGFGCVAVMLFTFVRFQLKLSQMKSEMESQLSGNPFRGLADMAMQSVQLQWGWAILIIGAGLVIASAAIKEESK